MTHSFGGENDTSSIKSVLSFSLFGLHLSLSVLTFLLLLAAIIEVDVLCGEFQAAGNHVHYRHQLTILPQHQLLLLARLICFNPAGTRVGCCLESLSITQHIYT